MPAAGSISAGRLIRVNIEDDAERALNILEGGPVEGVQRGDEPVHIEDYAQLALLEDIVARRHNMQTFSHSH